MIDLNTADILETIHMIDEEHLDIRTITMGISLLDDIEREYGIPIINKRISVTPISMILAASGGDPVKYALALERAAKEVGANYLTFLSNVERVADHYFNVAESIKEVLR